MFFLQLNVKTFFALLQALQPELERFTINDGDDLDHLPSSSEKITAVARRLLPSLRLYSLWLEVNVRFLCAELNESTLDIQIKEFWKIYASTLTLLASTFPPADLQAAVVEYQLEEDEDTVGFRPLVKPSDPQSDPLQTKPRFHDAGVERQHPNMEMMSRVTDLLLSGMQHVRAQVSSSCLPPPYTL